MAERYEVAIKVVSQQGTCVAHHKVGDEWVITSEKTPSGIAEKTPEGICIYAFDAMYPFAQVLMFGGAFPWESNPDVARVACPDGDNPVIFELRRVKE